MTITATELAAAELRNVAAALSAAHTIDGIWPQGEDKIKSHHDNLRYLAKLIDTEERTRLSEASLYVDALKSVYRVVHGTNPQPGKRDDLNEDIAWAHDHALNEIAAITELILGEGGTALDGEHVDNEMVSRPGYDALWGWFELSYASWLTLPRVLMHEMPDNWQALMAVLLRQWNQAWESDLSTLVVLKEGNRFVETPEWLVNYRHPRREDIEAARKK